MIMKRSRWEVRIVIYLVLVWFSNCRAEHYLVMQIRSFSVHKDAQARILLTLQLAIIRVLQ